MLELLFSGICHFKARFCVDTLYHRKIIRHKLMKHHIQALARWHGLTIINTRTQQVLNTIGPVLQRCSEIDAGATRALTIGKHGDR